MNWTQEQARAIELRNKNILVAAAAGSGKTAVLVERIKKLILEGECSIDRMLIVTFTNAAAAEMKEKIEKAIEKEAEENPSAVRLLKQQLDKMPLANISTFHAFALEVIRRFFYLIDVEPNFKICDNVQQELLKEQALDELLKMYFEEKNPEFFAFLNKYSGERNEDRFRQSVRKTFEVIQSLPEPFPWLRNAVAELDADFDSFTSGKIYRFIMDDTRSRLEEALRTIREFAETAERSMHDGVTEITASYLTLGAGLVEAAQSGDFEQVRAKLESVKMPSLLKKYFKPDDRHTQEELDSLKEALEIARIPLKDAVTSLKKDYFYDRIDNLQEEIRQTHSDGEFFLRTVEDYRDIFARLKKERGVVDFSDIEHYAYEILGDEAAASYYREKFAYIFIDEYQDSNLLQEALVARIKRENNLFMVGDVKQSIYKFRLAEPEIFQARYRDFAEAARLAEAEGGEALSEKIDLNRNFRSKKTVIDFINRIFERTMEGYDENAALHLGDPFGERCNFSPRLFLAETPWDENEELDDELKNMIKAEKEALAAAKIIRDSLGKTIFDSKKGIERPLQKGDIVILMRGIKNYGDIFYKILTDNNLPAYVDDNDGYFDTMEINVFMSLLAVIDNEKQDIPLLTVMRSEIFGFSIEELAMIRLACPEKCSYHDAVAYYCRTAAAGAAAAPDAAPDAAPGTASSATMTAAPGVAPGSAPGAAPTMSGAARETALRRKCLRLFESLEEWWLLARIMPLEELVWKLMLDTGFYIAMGAMPSGSRRQANLRALCDKALAYRKSQGGSLYGFMQYIEAVKQHKVSMGQVKMAAEGDDTIRIMTIHKSKGLEFPMILLAGFCRRLNYTKTGKDISVHKDLGIGFPIVNYEESWMKTSLIQNVIRVKQHREEVEEEKRILYVAMTRAKDILYILGMTDDYNDAVEALVRNAPGESSYFSMCGKRIFEDPEARGYISNGDLRALSEGRRRNTARALELLEPDAGLDAGGSGLDAGGSGLDAGGSSPITNARLSKEVESRMSFEYPYAADLKIKSKYAVSELAGKTDAEISLTEPKSFKASTQFTPAQIGTLTHKVLEKIDFNAATAAATMDASAAPAAMAGSDADTGSDAAAEAASQTITPDAAKSYVAALVESMVADEFLTAEEAAAINQTNLSEFIISPLGRRMATAAKKAAAGAASDFLGLQREKPFNLVCDAEGARSIVQGIIDCFFEEEAELVLVDYKTTGVRSEDELAGREERIRARYATQIELYKKALEAATGKKVKEAYLYLTNIGETIAM